MNINIDGIKNQLQVGYQFLVAQSGQLADRTVKVLTQAVELIRQDKRAAVATVAIANVLILHTALLITDLADRAFIWLSGPEENWSQARILFNSFVALALFSSLVVGANVCLYQQLKLPLTPVATVAISTATCASYIFIRLWRTGEIGSEG
jgi:hypothetical protein